MAPVKKKLEYTSAAFEQDANQAMRGDVIRGLIELITNCDDAYSRAGKTGTIEILIHRPAVAGEPIEVCVRDRATGLDPEAMEKNLGVLGNSTSGFEEGKDVRGLFSRGARDTATFGETRFEAIKGGMYSVMTVMANSEYLFESEKATESHYKSLGLQTDENGFSATMVIRNIRVPDFSKVFERLSAHVQLRRILCSQDVKLLEFKNSKLTKNRALVWEEPASESLFEGAIDIAGYNCQAHLELRRLEEPSTGPVGVTSIHGIEVHGNRAVFMNENFNQTGPGMARIRGIVQCGMIDELIRTFDPNGPGDDKNPMRLVTRSRDGLVPEHPFTQALSVAVLEKLKPILAELEPDDANSGSKELRRDLNALARLLAEKMKNDLDEDEDDSFGQQPTPTNPIIIIPPRTRVRLGSNATLTVLVYEKSEAAQGLKATSSSPVCTVESVSEELVHHATFKETLVGQVRIKSIKLGSANVTVFAKTEATVSAQAEIVVHDIPTDEEPPADLEWKNSAMSVTAGKSRSVRLRAPISLAPNGELGVSVSLESKNILLDNSTVTLTLTKKGWLEGRVYVTAVEHSAEASRIVAIAEGSEAIGTIRTKLPSPLGGLNFEVELVKARKGPIRGEMIVDEDGTTMYIYGEHRALANRLGPYADGVFERERELDTLVVMAEIMASVAADHVVMKKVKDHPELYSDIDNIIYERTKLTDGYISVLVEGLSVVIGK